MNILSYIPIGIVGLLVLFTIIAILFGKKVEKQYDLEAEFRDENGKEFAEFDIYSWRYEKEGGDFQLHASFNWRDQRLSLGSTVEILLAGAVILQGAVEKAGKIRLNKDNLVNEPKDPEVGQLCQIKLNGEVILEEVLAED